MITQQLERWIASGDAYYTTHTHGYSGIGVIPVPQKTYIIITSIEYFPFADPFPPDESPLEAIDFLNRAIHQVEIVSRKSSNSFIFRDTIQITADPAGQMDPAINFGDPIHKDVYLVHQEEIRIRIGTVQGIPISFISIPIPGEPPFPIGYGLEPAIAAIQGQAIGDINTQILPQSKKIVEGPIVITSGGRNQMRIDYEDSPGPTVTTILNRPLFPIESDFWGRTFPIINFGMVVINKEALQNVQSTSGQ